MIIAPEQFSGLLQECLENSLILTDDEREFVQGLQFQTSSGVSYSQGEAKRLQDIYFAFTNRQLSG